MKNSPGTPRAYILNDKKSSKIDIRKIQSIISNYFNISMSQLKSNNKKKSYSYPRHLAIYLSKKYTDLSHQEIGFFFGERNHSTVLYAIKKIENLKGKNFGLRGDLINIENLLI